jgi:hypothetical protein
VAMSIEGAVIVFSGVQFFEKKYFIFVAQTLGRSAMDRYWLLTGVFSIVG